jgi:hypothetical protein
MNTKTASLSELIQQAKVKILEEATIWAEGVRTIQMSATEGHQILAVEQEV